MKGGWIPKFLKKSARPGAPKFWSPVPARNVIRAENIAVSILILVACQSHEKWIVVFLSALHSCLKSRIALQAENLALRHEIGVLQRGCKKPHLHSADRFFWVWLSRLWADWASALAIVKPETVIAWHRKGFRLYWTWKSRQTRVGRGLIPQEVRDLIRKMSAANPLWGAPRIHGELLKLGIAVSRATVAKYMNRQRKPPSQSWRAFLNNHVRDLVAIDFFSVPTVSFRVLFVFVILAHDRRDASIST